MFSTHDNRLVKAYLNLAQLYEEARDGETTPEDDDVFDADDIYTRVLSTQRELLVTLTAQTDLYRLFRAIDNAAQECAKDRKSLKKERARFEEATDAHPST